VEGRKALPTKNNLREDNTMLETNVVILKLEEYHQLRDELRVLSEQLIQLRSMVKVERGYNDEPCVEVNIIPLLPQINSLFETSPFAGQWKLRHSNLEWYFTTKMYIFEKVQVVVDERYYNGDA